MRTVGLFLFYSILVIFICGAADGAIITKAHQGDALAQLQLGDYYFSRKAYKQSVDWYIKSALQNNTNAMYQLGLIYMNGTGEKQDYSKALSWLRLSSEKGNNDATYQLCKMNFEGIGIAKNYSKAFILCNKTASTNNEYNADSQFMVARMHQNGLGTASNYEKAKQYYTFAAIKKHQQSQQMLVQLYANEKNLIQSCSWAIISNSTMAECANIDKIELDKNIQHLRAIYNL